MIYQAAPVKMEILDFKEVKSQQTETLSEAIINEHKTKTRLSEEEFGGASFKSIDGYIRRRKF